MPLLSYQRIATLRADAEIDDDGRVVPVVAAAPLRCLLRFELDFEGLTGEFAAVNGEADGHRQLLLEFEVEVGQIVVKTSTPG